MKAVREADHCEQILVVVEEVVMDIGVPSVVLDQVKNMILCRL